MSRGKIQFFILLLCHIALITPRAAASVMEPKGAKIYRQQCVKCHGKNGEGVKGKYDDALTGDWSLEKLTRYIDKNMPDDAPEKCVGEEAKAVARFIDNAFYSREAQARNHPVRIELVHLTNRQYVNAVADLLKSFTGADSPAGIERGLRATYFNSKNFNANKKFQERVDRQVNFDFGEGALDPQDEGTNGFSMQWRGSLIAEETGSYEFILKTPNGARLWINDDDEPIIDASVASSDVSERTTTLRLIGGRLYPLKLDSFKSPKDKTASIVLQWKPPHGVKEIIPARNLSPARVSPTFMVTTPFPPDDSSVGYERGVAVSKAWDEATTYAAIETANDVVKNLDRLSRSKSDDTNRVAKLENFCEEFVATAFRRPLTSEQKRLFVSAQFKKAKNTDDAVKRVVLLALKSPQFLYLGLGNGQPDDFEIASHLSFALWDSLPNRDLTKLASQGKLHTREQVSGQAQLMLNDPRAHAKMQYFFQQWLQMNRAEDLSKDTTLYPGFSGEIIADLRTSLNLFLEDTVWNGASDFRQLLLSKTIFVNERLAQFYGIDVGRIISSRSEVGRAASRAPETPVEETNDDFVKVEFPDRSGVVTHPYLLAAFSYQKSTSPIHRGVFLTRNIVGRALKPPPMAQVFNDASFAPNLSMREKVATLTKAQSCQSCHSVINPLGFSLENYDAVGRFRTEENDRPINATSEYITDDGQTVHLRGARDVAEFAITSEHAQNGFIEQLFHQIVKQPVLAYGPDTMNQLRQTFVSSDFNLRKLLVEMATISALHGIEKSMNGNKVARLDEK